MTALVHRGSTVLRADPGRVIAKLFLPGQEMVARGISRADAVVGRLLAMTDAEVSSTLARTLADFADRHPDLPVTFAAHFALVAHRVPDATAISAERRQLIGAYFTHEYSVEAAAFFNPSIVEHPDQTGLATGDLRFIMSARAVGEGHVSSIEFRTGVVSASGAVHIDDPGRLLRSGRAEPAPMSREFLRQLLSGGTDPATEYILNLLPDEFTADHLDTAFATFAGERLTRGSADAIVERIRWIASCNYRLHFPPDPPLSELVIVPTGPDETQGVEDARFTRFVEEDGSTAYYATYTAFDGTDIAPHLLRTEDFRTFDIGQVAGPAATNKGMALFPRRINGRFWALSRWDRENNGVASSTDGRTWSAAVTIQTPERAWELIQLGNCGSPIETADGWLVLTHGVGPMRTYGIGAILLDLDDPTKVIGALEEPLLTPTGDEREGYVPNVLYSCGALLHGESVLIPYGCSDSSIRFAVADLPAVLRRLNTHR